MEHASHVLNLCKVISSTQVANDGIMRNTRGGRNVVAQRKNRFGCIAPTSPHVVQVFLLIAKIQETPNTSPLSFSGCGKKPWQSVANQRLALTGCHWDVTAPF